MGSPVNLSRRYIDALRQLPQYFCCMLDDANSVTHVMTGVRVFATGDLEDENDTSEELEVLYPGGYKISVNGSLFLKIAIKEGAEIEINTIPNDFSIPKGEQTPVQLRISDLEEHLKHKHSLS